MSNDKSPLTPQPGILDIAPYVPGEAKIAGHADPAQLAANENALGPDTAAIAAFGACARPLHR